MYVAYLSHAAGIHPNKHADLDLTALKLLDTLASCHYHEPLTVTEAMELQEIASAATLHRKLDELELAGLIIRTNVDDRRTKHVLITQKAEDYFLALSRAMVNAITDRIKP